jgi:hypothetical protein
MYDFPTKLSAWKYTEKIAAHQYFRHFPCKKDEKKPRTRRGFD